MSLDNLRLWSVVGFGRVDWSLPPILLFASLCLAALHFLPAVAWVAALSPTNTTTTLGTNITITNYVADPTGTYWNSSWNAFAPAAIQYVDHHSFSFVPGATMGSSLYDSFATASFTTSEPRLHSKGDGTLYNYVGRSYGVGAPVGLVNITSHIGASYLGYAYQELGYQIHAKCIFNKSSALTLEESFTPDTGDVPNLFILTDEPSGGTFYAVASFNDTQSIVAFGFGDISQNTVGILAGSEYSHLNQLGCTFDFVPTTFRVTSNLTSQRIQVEPIGSGADIDPTASEKDVTLRHRIQQNVIMEIIRLSQRDLNLYSSNIGESFKANIERNISASWDSATDVQILEAAAASFEAVIDDILLAISSAQYMLGPQGSKKAATATMSVDALTIGAAYGIWVVFAFNSSIVLVWLVTAVRSRLWANTPAWDFLGVDDLVVATSRGGTAIAEALSSASSRSWERPGLFATMFKRSGSMNRTVDLKLAVTAGGQDALVPVYYSQSSDP